MSHFFEDVGNVITAPFRAIGGFVSGNPKYNSIGDLYDKTIGPENPIADTFNNEGLNKAARLFSAPSWDALGKPGEAFANFIDTQNSILPADWRPYAQPVESALLNFIPGVGPLVSAAYNTAYQGGVQQRDNKGFDWGELGKNAAINFGTAAATMGANSLVSNANNAANASKDAATLANFNAATNQASGTSSALSSTAANAARNTQGALAAFSPSAVTPAMTLINGGVGAATGASTPTFSNANTVASSGSNIGDFAYKSAVNSAPKLVNEALTSTLAPQGTQPISGVMNGFSATPSLQTGAPTQQWGALLNAFGGDEGNTPNPNGPRYDETAINNAVVRLGANNYLQQSQARDTALPAGQYTPEQNTPYANRLDEINKGTDQSYQDLRSQIDNANNYYGFLDTNPGLTTEQLDTYINNPDSIGQINNANKYYSILSNNEGLTADELNTYLADPSTGVLGKFSVPSESAGDFAGLTTPTMPNDFFTAGNQYMVPPNASTLAGLRPLGPSTMSLL